MDYTELEYFNPNMDCLNYFLQVIQCVTVTRNKLSDARSDFNVSWQVERKHHQQDHGLHLGYISVAPEFCLTLLHCIVVSS